MIGKNGYASFCKLLSYSYDKKSNPKASIQHFEYTDMRGVGKSYNMKFNLMNRYKYHNGEIFVCLYRTKPELEEAKISWIDQLVKPDPTDKKHPKYRFEDFKWYGSGSTTRLFWKNKLVGYFLAIEDVNKIKHRNFDYNTCWVWLDEFIPLAQIKMRGIASEGDALEMIVDTIDHNTINRQAREKPVRVIMFGNMVSINSPLMQYFGIRPYQYGFYRPKKDVVVENAPPDITKVRTPEQLRDLRRYQLATDKLAFIKKKPATAIPDFSLRLGDLENHYYTFYRADNHYYIHLTNDHKGIIKYGVIRDKQENEKSIAFFTGKSSYKPYLRERADLCEDYYTTLECKLNYLMDIS